MNAKLVNAKLFQHIQPGLKCFSTGPEYACKKNIKNTLASSMLVLLVWAKRKRKRKRKRKKNQADNSLNILYILERLNQNVYLKTKYATQ